MRRKTTTIACQTPVRASGSGWSHRLRLSRGSELYPSSDQLSSTRSSATIRFDGLSARHGHRRTCVPVAQLESTQEVPIVRRASLSLAALHARRTDARRSGRQEGVHLGRHGGHQRDFRIRPALGRGRGIRPLEEAHGRRCQRRHPRRQRRRRNRDRGQRLARQHAEPAPRGSRARRAARQPQLQALGDDGRVSTTRSTP